MIEKTAFAGIPIPREPYSVIIIGDFLKDLDDEHSLCGSAGLTKLGIIELKCVIGNLSPARLRALGAKGTLNMLGMGNVPVGIGTAVFEGKTHPYESDIPYLADISEVHQDGQDLLVRTLENCQDNSVILILESGMTDAANLLREYPDLFKNKVRSVTIMGGVETKGQALELDESGLAVPNNANNNSFDMESAVWLYRELQLRGIPMTITTREVAYAAKVPFAAYDRFEATGNPIGRCLKGRQLPSMQHLWEAACSPAGSAIRGTLPSDRNREWFVKVFCAGIEPGIADDGDIWPYVDCFNLYDPSNLYASIPELQALFLYPTVFEVCGVQHKVIGVSNLLTGVKNAAEFSRFMVDIELYGLQR